MVYLVLLVEFVVLFFTSQFIFKSTFSLMFALSHSKRLASGVVSLLFSPGVFVHELAHYVMARLLLVKVTKFSMVPNLEGEHLQMGSVEIHKPDRFRNLMIGIAPIILGLVLIYLLSRFFLINISFSELFDSWTSFFKVVLAGLLVFLIANTMFSSKKDLEGAWIVGVIGLVVVGLLVFLKVPLQDSIIQFFSQEKIQDWVGRLSIVLAIPVVLNVLVVGVFRLVKRY